MSEQQMQKEVSPRTKAALAVVSAMQPDVPAGCDDGHFGIKVCTDDWAQIYVPSRVSLGSQLISMDDSDENCFVSGGESYTVSSSIASIDTRFQDYPLSDVNRVLVAHALIKAGYGGKNVKLITGLPVQDYYVGSVRNTAFIDRKVKNLLDGAVSNRNPSVVCAKIVAHQVISEGIAAFYDMLVDKNGNINGMVADQVANGSIAILDIGGKTTDSAVIVNGGKGIDANRSGTAHLGGLSLNAAVEPRLKAHLKVDSLSTRQIEDAVTKGVLRAFGGEHDVAEIVLEEKRALAHQIISECKRKMRDAADLEAVYFVGGGSLLLRDQLEDLFPHGVFVEDPQFANARGMLKFAKYILG